MTYSKNQRFKDNNISNESIAEINTYPIKHIKERGLTLQVCELYGIRTATSEEDSDKAVAYYFPVHREGHISGYIKRKAYYEGTYRYELVGNITHQSDLFGEQIESHGNGKLYITEGPVDAASVAQVLLRKAKGTKWEGMIPPVVSITLGAGNALKQLMEKKEFLRKFKEIVLVFDNDKATKEQRKANQLKGMDAVADVCLNLGLNISYVVLPLKDANEMLMAGRGKELSECVLFQTQRYQPELLTTIGDIDEEVEELMRPLEKGIMLDCLPRLSEMIGGVRESELTILLAETGIGKTSIYKQIAAELVFKHNKKIACFFLEEDVKKAKQSFVAIAHQVRLSKYRVDPGKYISKSDTAETMQALKDAGTIFYDNDNANLIDIKSLISMMRYCAINGVEHLFFDHLTFAVAGQTESNDTKLLDTLLAEMSLIPRGYKIHIWLISHINREGQKLSKPPKNEDGEIDYPYWVPVPKISGRSSGALEQCSWNLWTFEAEMADEQERRGRRRVVIKKNREYGELGIADVLDMNPITGVMEPVK